MGWSQILQELNQARLQLDKKVEEDCAQAREARVSIHCTSGCCNCCSLAVNCSYPEALQLSRTLSADQQQAVKEILPRLREISLAAPDLKEFLRSFRDQLGGCPFLTPEDGCCSVYSDRPFSCRALISTRNSSWCAVDFAGLHPLEQEAFLSSLDPEVVAFPTHYLAAPQETGLEMESLALVAMRENFHVALSGNLIYQVWLELEHRLSEIIPHGLGATRNYLERHQLDLPFLLQLQGD